MLRETPVVTCFLRNRGEVLLLKRSGEVGSYRGRWGGVAGHVEGNDSDGSAIREIAEETGLEQAVRLVTRGESFPVDDEELGKRFLVHPYLFDCASRDARLDWESTSGDWVAPTEILRRDCVPRLWTSYERVAPTLESIASDREHGSTWLSLRALEVLRDHAGWLAAEEAEPETAGRELKELASALVAAQPSMVVIENRVGRVARELRETADARVAEGEAHRAIGRAIDVDCESAQRAAELVAGKRVLTLSRSDTVSMALVAAKPAPRVVVAESRPGCEGIGVAEELSRQGLEVVLVADAGIAEAITSLSVKVVLVGADRVLPSGAVVNKTGTRLAALAAREAGIPFYCVASTDKVSMTKTWSAGPNQAADLYRGEARIEPRNVLFEVTPAALVTAIVTEVSVIRPEQVSSLVPT